MHFAVSPLFCICINIKYIGKYSRKRKAEKTTETSTITTVRDNCVILLYCLKLKKFLVTLMTHSCRYLVLSINFFYFIKTIFLLLYHGHPTLDEWFGRLVHSAVVCNGGSAAHLAFSASSKRCYFPRLNCSAVNKGWIWVNGVICEQFCNSLTYMFSGWPSCKILV